MANLQDDKKKKKGLFLSFFSLRAYYGIFSALMAVLGIVCFVIFTLIVERIPGKLDMTKEKIYSLSSESKKILDGIKSPLRIDLVWQKDIEDQYALHDLYTHIDAFLKQYKQQSKYIDYRVLDPLSYPDVIASYMQGQNQKIEHGSLIVASGSFTRVLPFESWSGYQGSGRTEFNAESPVTNAILYVIGNKVPKIYTVVGHGELDIARFIQNTGKSFLDTLIENNIEVLPLTLQTSEIPEDADALMILSPLGDFSFQEIDELRRFMAKKGQLWINLSYTKENLFGLESFLKEYNLSLRGIVAEMDENRLLPNMKNNPLYFLVQRHNFPGETENQPGSEKISDANGPLVMGQALLLMRDKSENSEFSTEAYPLISTSDKAVLLGRNARDKFTDSGEREKFHLAYTVIDKTHDQSLETRPLRLVVTTGDLSLMSRFSGTSQFYIDVVSWLDNVNERIRIPGKKLGNASLQITSKIFVVLSCLFVVMVPTFFIVMGIMIWNKRRHM